MTDFTAYSLALGDFLHRCLRPGRPRATKPDPAEESEFNQLACALFRLQRAYVGPYRRLCDARSIIPDQVEHWSQIPVVPTAAFKEWEFTSLPPGDRSRVFLSSGTTEPRPSRHFHSAESLRAYEASLRPWFRQHLLPEMSRSESLHPARMLLLVPPPEQAPTSSLVHMVETIRREHAAPGSAFAAGVDPDGTWVVDIEQATGWLERQATEGEPLVILGTALTIAELLDSMARPARSFVLPAGSRIMETGGYKGRTRAMPREDLHAAITGSLGIPPSHIVSEYGMTELSSQAYDHVAGEGVPPAGRQFCFPPWVRSRVIHPETGRPASEGDVGLLRVYDLANLRSLLAIQTDDLATCRGTAFGLVGRVPRAEPRGCSLNS